MEGLHDLIHAETELQRQQAMTQASGQQGRLFQQWREKIIESMAILEAYIDFGEDEEIPSHVIDQGMNESM